MSQLEFSKLTGISPPRVSSYTRRISTPGLEMALKIFEATHGKVTFREMIRINEDSFQNPFEDF